MKKTFFAVAVFSSGFVFAEGWNLAVGYAWRPQADTSFRGGAPAAAGKYADVTIQDDLTWSGEGAAMDELPTAGTGMNPTGTKGNGYDYALRVGRDESVVSGGGDDDSAHGLTASVGYDFLDVGPVSFGANLRFAGYWGIENGARGGYCSYNDYFRISTALGEPVQGEDVVDSQNYEKREYLAGGPGGRTTLKSDLYQIGFGPKVTWHVLSCLDVYGGVEALCTFANSELDAGGASTDEVNCLWGVGGHVGFTGWMTENVGLFGQVGYEWIDEDDVSVRGVRAETDYSSLVLSAGLQIRF